MTFILLQKPILLRYTTSIVKFKRYLNPVKVIFNVWYYLTLSSVLTFQWNCRFLVNYIICDSYLKFYFWYTSRCDYVFLTVWHCMDVLFLCVISSFFPLKELDYFREILFGCFFSINCRFLIYEEGTLVLTLFFQVWNGEEKS